ncbi:MAG: hypothetical protein U5N55_08635 [Cypionkella sp.]|nr:hypothetical protein [Cypionkella sp.]
MTRTSGRDKTDDYRDISNAASLLSRLELEGMSATAGTNWPTCRNAAQPMAVWPLPTCTTCWRFVAVTGDSAAAGHDRPHAQWPMRPCSEAQRIIAHPGLHVAQGLQAFAAGEYSAALMHLRAGRADLQQIGGSHAQRDVFDRITIEAALRGGYTGSRRGAVARPAERGVAGALDGYALSAARLSPDRRRAQAQAV